jgi:nucleotide-binding universal stress UspA family protein
VALTNMYEEIVVALDGSATAERVLPHAEALSRAFGSHITLIRATLSAEMVLAQTGAGEATTGTIAAPMDPQPVLDADQTSADDYLQKLTTTLRQQDFRVDAETPHGPANTVIVERARALQAKLILMTTHGRSGLGRMVFGSVADSVLRHAPCPVLLVRIGEEDETLRMT